MPLEVVVELQIRAISCPGVFLPDKQDVYLGVYLLNQYLETDCFPSVFPIMIQQSMRFEKVFENAIDPGAVAEILESFLTRFELIQLVSPAWEELACYEENTRDFLFPEPKLTPSLPGMYRQVLMKTFAGFPGHDSRKVVLFNPFLDLTIIALILLLRKLDKIDPGIAPKIEFSTRTAIRERVFLHRNRFLEEREKSRRPLSTSDGPRSPLNNVRMRPKDSKVESTQSWAPPPCSPRCFVQDQPTPPSLGNNFRISGESKPPFVVRHVDSAKPFGDNISELQPRKSRMKPKFSNLPFPGRRASSFDSFAANIKVIKEPDERIVLRKESPSPLDSSKFGKPSPSYGNPGDADFHREASFATYQPSRSSSPLLDQPLLRERFHLYSQSTWRKIHERVCGLLTSHRAQQHLNKEYTISETKYILERPSYPNTQCRNRDTFRWLSYDHVPCAMLPVSQGKLE